ncbi:MAG: hypothetical protein FJ340_07610 [Sphingomonadales bacterium]|nr:hypothetical protein [Sphingomonadales bacterium]
MNESAKESGWQQTENQFMMGDYVKGLLRRVRGIVAYWRLLLIVGAIGSVIGLVYAIFTPPVYQAKVNFVIEENKQNTGGLFSALGRANGNGPFCFVWIFGHLGRRQCTDAAKESHAA